MLFLKEKTTSIFLSIKKASSPLHISEIARRSGASYLYTTRTLKRWEELGLVKMEGAGKKKRVVLTDKGLDISKIISDLNQKEEKIMAVHKLLNRE